MRLASSTSLSSSERGYILSTRMYPLSDDDSEVELVGERIHSLDEIRVVVEHEMGHFVLNNDADLVERMYPLSDEFNFTVIVGERIHSRRENVSSLRR